MTWPACYVAWSRCIDVDPELGPVEPWQRAVGNTKSRAQQITDTERSIREMAALNGLAPWPASVWSLCWSTFVMAEWPALWCSPLYGVRCVP